MTAMNFLNQVVLADAASGNAFGTYGMILTLDRVHYGLDYFDASINRIGAYVIGSRAAQKCMTRALLEPIAKLREYEANGQGFQRLALLEEEKALPWNAVWHAHSRFIRVPLINMILLMKWDSSSILRQKDTSIPVSYTHLDVYKRQGIHFFKLRN